MGNSKNTVEEVLKIFNNGWNKQVILYGPPGTSKTYSATEIAAKFLASKEPNEGDNTTLIDIMKSLIQGEKDNDLTDHEICERYLENKKNQYKVIQFHPSYSYEDFVRGIVVKTKDNNGQQLQTPAYEVERKIVETFGKDATEDEPRVLVIDEINRAPLGSVLGELIYGLEYRGKAVSTPYTYKEKNNQGTEEEVPLKISEHLYIIGTMNTADRSIGTMDYAVRRRFAFIPVFPCADKITGSWKYVGKLAKELFIKLMDEGEGIFSKDYLEDAELDVNDIKIGHTYFLGREKENNKETEENEIETEENEIEYLKYRIKYQIKPVYQEYIKDGMIRKTGLERFDEIEKEAFNNYNTQNQNNS